MRSEADEKRVRAALVVGEIMDRISLGIVPRRAGDLPSDFDPSRYPSVRFLSGIEIELSGTRPSAALLYELPDGEPLTVRLACPTLREPDRRDLVDVCHAFVERSWNHEAHASGVACGQDVRTLHLAGRPLEFTSATIEIACRAVMDDIGRLPEPDEIGRFFDGFLADHAREDVLAAVSASPRATCYAALAVRSGMRVWPCRADYTPYLH